MPMVGKMLGNGANPKTIIIIGIMLTFGFLMLLGFASPDSNENNFYFPFVLRGFGMAFMMSPILALAVGGLKGKDMVQAIGLANMIRQLGGAVGIALINLYLTHLNAEIRGNMISHVNMYDEVSSERVSVLTQNFVSRGFSLEEAQSLAYKMLEGALYKQQALVSYNQGFLMVGFIILICIPVVLCIRYKKGEKAKVVADH
jgi:DHA2 family multidrug resistance protein